MRDCWYTGNVQPKQKVKFTYVPFRYLLSISLMLAEYVTILAVVIWLTIYLPYFYIAVVITQMVCTVGIINAKDNPDYKVPWLFFVMLIPIIGFMTYFLFYNRNISKRQQKGLKAIQNLQCDQDDSVDLATLQQQNPVAYAQATALKNLSRSKLYTNTAVEYFPSGEAMHERLLADLRAAKEFIFLDYFIIEQGVFWQSILDILMDKVATHVEVRVVYDDIGCMTKLPGNYDKRLRKMGIKAVTFGKLKGQANNEFNNRCHRKMTIIDGQIAYTGGINLADEYINRVPRFGYWKDVAIRLTGAAVDEMTRLFLVDYCLNDHKNTLPFATYYRHHQVASTGYCLPFGDGPKPLFPRRVAKTAIMNMLNSAQQYVYITTPYLIIDGELTAALENTALRGVDVRIITPHIPDKKAIFMMTRNSYDRLLAAGVKIFEYAPGFIHAKTYLSDDQFAIVGTINLDYRSLVHHYENGVWLYNHPVIATIKDDFMRSQQQALPITPGVFKENLLKKLFRSIINIFAPLL